MKKNQFRKYAHEMVDWMADYLENVEQYPVKAQVAPGDISKQLPLSPPVSGENFADIFTDFEKIILPGMTHWQHPSFFAYFPSNTSPPSILAEMLTATMAAQCMSWETSPAATELEERMMNWLQQMLGLPAHFVGVIQDSASSAALCSLLTAREQATKFSTNHTGLKDAASYTAYCSMHAHSSVDRAVRIAGIGDKNLRKIPVDEHYALLPAALEQAIKKDIEEGRKPLWIVATIGTTSSTAIDPLRAIGEICKKYQIWLHVDAAYAGTALLLPEMRAMIDGIVYVDSFDFNPHKWMLTNFDCSAYFVKDKMALLNTLAILPEYLKTKQDSQVNNYRDWSIPLGRRFRALKLWFVIRGYGVAGMQTIIRQHISLAQNLAEKIRNSENFELLAPVPLNLVCFRYKPKSLNDNVVINKINQKLLDTLNSTGKIYLTHTKLNDVYTLRLVVGQTYVEQKHVDDAWQLIQKHAKY